MFLARNLAISLLPMFVLACGDDSGPAVDGSVRLDGSGGDSSVPSDAGMDAGRDAARPDGGPGSDGDVGDGGGDAGSCVTSADCPSGVCILLMCRPAACTDGIRNGEESDRDCGGSECPGCDPGEMCTMPTDCMSNICTDGACVAPSCPDGVLNQDETDIDCGGRACMARCAEGQMCNSASDCVTRSCSATGACQAPSCTDGVRNGTETDIDCGGPVADGCPRCAEYARCAATRDCTSPDACTMGHCGTACSFGMDTFGYRGCSYTPTALPCPDIRTTGTATMLGDDDETTAAIGFPFEFYGATHTEVQIESNGTLSFPVGGYLGSFNDCLPDTFTTEGFVALMWDDLDPGATGSGVYYEVVGTAPSRSFVVTWETERYNATAGERAIFTAVLEEGSNDVHVCYVDTSFADAAYDRGLAATAGIQGSDTEYLELSCDTADLTDGLYVRYIHP